MNISNRKGVIYTPWMVTARSEYLPSEKAHGFVYLIRNMGTGEFYIGKKQIYQKAKKGQERKYTDWRTYKSSCDKLKADIKNGDMSDFHFLVLWECDDETALKYTELEEIIKRRSFASEFGLNSGISIRQISKIKDLESRRFRVYYAD